MRPVEFHPRFRAARRALPELAARESWDRTTLASYQLDQLNRLWAHATSTVPYYRTMRRELNLPTRFSDLAEFSTTVPVLERATIQTSRRALLSETPGRGRWHSTSGSTGNPMKVFWGRLAHLDMLRARYRHHESWDVDIFDRQVLLHDPAWWIDDPDRGRQRARPRPIPWVRTKVQDRLRRRLRLSAVELAPAQLARYLDRIIAFQPRALYGYSGAVHLLAQCARVRGFRCDSLKLVTLTGETATPRMIAEVERGLGAPAVLEYGATECPIIATEGPDRRLRVREDLVIVEAVRDAAGHYDILITTLGNLDFPLIRYAIGDVTDAPLTVPARGFAELANVLGKSNDFLVTQSGKRVPPYMVEWILQDYLDGVRGYRAHQDVLGRLTVWVEPAEDTSVVSRGAAKRLERFLEGYPVTLEVVDAIPVSPTGKRCWIGSDLASSSRAEEDPIGTSD